MILNVFVRMFAAIVAVLASAPAHALSEQACKTLTISGNPEYPPLLWADPAEPGRLVGAVPALLREIVEPMGLELTVRDLGSWARVQRVAALVRSI